ncbi:MAG: YceK/YidQ family lipoprotein [Solirubrobacteraceae bacterium]
MTVDTQLNKGYKGPRVYSGVRKDLSLMGPAFLNLNFGWVVITLFDFPFSLVADTLILPVTIPRDLDRGKVEEEHERVDTERPAVVYADAGEAPADTARRLFDACRALLQRQSPDLSDCFSIEAVITLSGAQPLKGAAYKPDVREAIERDRDDGIFVDWRDPTFELEGERVRIRATRRSSREPPETPLVFVLGAGSDGGWRIVEEISVGWPER